MRVTTLKGKKINCFSFREDKLFLSSIFKIKNREQCLVVNKLNDKDIREETKNENEEKEK